LLAIVLKLASACNQEYLVVYAIPFLLVQVVGSCWGSIR